MTDGESNDGSFYDVQKYYHMNKETTPIVGYDPTTGKPIFAKDLGDF
mgnify:CR=1 FL=1